MQAVGNCIAGAEEGKIAAEEAYLEPQLFSVERLHWSRLFVATRRETNGAGEKSRYVMFKVDPTGVHEAVYIQQDRRSVQGVKWSYLRSQNCAFPLLGATRRPDSGGT